MKITYRIIGRPPQAWAKPAGEKFRAFASKGILTGEFKQKSLVSGEW
jgi:hypothetical protein